MAAVVHRLSNAAVSFFDSRAPAIVVDLVIRLKVSETPAFQPLEDENGERKVPLLTVFKRYERQGFGALFATMAIQGTQGLTTVWGGSVAVAAGEDESDCLSWKAVGALTPLIVTFVVARLSDRFGRKRTLISAHSIAAVLALPLVLPIVSGDINHYALAILLGNGIVQGMCFGPIAAARGAGLSPMIASALIMIPGTGSDLIGGVWSLVALGGIVAVAVGRPFDETSAEPMFDNNDLVLEFDEPHEASESELTVPVTQIVES